MSPDRRRTVEPTWSRASDLTNCKYHGYIPLVTAEPHPDRSETDREIEMLAQLAEIGLDLAKAVAEFTKDQLAQATAGYAPNAPGDPSQAFARLAQTVRRTIALKHHLREHARTRADEPGSAGDLFRAPPKRGIDLNPPPPVDLPTAKSAPERERAFDGPGDCPAADQAAPRESLKSDLGRLLDDPERFIEQVPRAPTRRIVAQLCETIDLDPQRLKWRDGRWFVAQSSRDPVALWHDTPLNIWRPPWPGVPIRHYIPPI